MTTISKPQFPDAGGLTYADHLLIRRLILGGLSRTAVAVALFGSDGSPQQDKAARAFLRELATAAGTYVRGPGRPGPARDALNAQNAQALGT